MPGKNAYITELQSKRIKECIEMCGITQAYIAEKLNYTPQHISYVVNGKRALSKELAIGLADLFSDLLPPESVSVKMPFSELSDDEKAEYTDDIDARGYVTAYYDTPRIDYRYLLGEMDNRNVYESSRAESVDSVFFSGVKAILHHYGYNISAAGFPPVTVPAPTKNAIFAFALKSDTREYKITNTKTGETQNFSAAELYFLFRDFSETIYGIMDRTFCKKRFENEPAEIQNLESDSAELPPDWKGLWPE